MISDKEKNFVSLVVYVRNSENCIEKFLEIVDRELEKNFEKYEIICVNDASDDESVNVIGKYAANRRNGVISVINMSYFQGVETSMNAGVDLAIGDFVFEFDTIYVDNALCDMLMEAYRHALKGYDIVSVVPDKNRNRLSSLFYKLYNMVSHTKNKLCTETFCILSRRGINRICSINKNIPYRKPIYANCGLPVDYLVYKTSEKEGLKPAGNTDEERIDTAVNSLILFTDVAYRVSVWFAITMMLGAALGGLYVISVHFSHRKPIEGWTTTMMFLTLCFCAVFALLAIIIKYLSIILKMIFQKQKYLIDSISKYGN